MVAESQTLSVRDFPAYLHFTPRPDQPERFDEQTAFYESKGDGVAWMIGGNGAGTTTTLLAKVARFIYETPPPRPDTPFWVIAKSYDQVTKTCWKEKLYGQGHILDKDVDWARVGWYKSKQRLPYSVPLKPNERGNNWMLEFRSYEQGIGAMMAQAIGGFAFVEQFPWGVFEEVLRGCREYNFPGSKLVEYTPVDPDLSIDIEEMIENEGWMYLYELGFSTWDDYERSCVSDEDEERAEVALREEEADFEAAEREDFVYWITDEDEELIDIFNALEVEKAQDHLQDDRWSYQPGDSDAEEYFELLYTYKSLTGQL